MDEVRADDTANRRFAIGDQTANNWGERVRVVDLAGPQNGGRFAVAGLRRTIHREEWSDAQQMIDPEFGAIVETNSLHKS